MKKTVFALTVLALTAMLCFPVLSNVSAATYVSGSVGTSAVWSSSGNPYYLNGNVIVNNAETLTIQNGVVVHMNGYQIMVYGSLYVQGQALSKVSFLNDGNSNSQIFFGSQSSSTCSIYSSVFYGTSIMVGGGSPLISSCYFTGSSSTPITVNGGNPVIMGSVINAVSQNCITVNQASATINSNTLSGSRSISNFGIYSIGGSITIVENSITNCYTGIYSTGQATISQNTIVNNLNDAISSRNFNQNINSNVLAYNTVGISGDGNIQNNTITGNQYGIYGQTSLSTIRFNNIYSNTENVHLTENSTDVDAANNYWGFTDSESIYSRISDIHIHSNLGTLNYIPFLFTPAVAPAEVQSVPVPTVPPTPSANPSITVTPTPTPTSKVTPTPTPTPTYYYPTPTPYYYWPTPTPYQTYYPTTPYPYYYTTPSPTPSSIFGDFSPGDVTNVVVILVAVVVAITIIVVINRKFSRQQNPSSEPLPPPPQYYE